jgi:phosphoribosyl 1,2-cyclic phosphate phosphodiesterase
MRLLRGLELMVIDGLRFRPHPTHFSIPEALKIISELKPKLALLTHLTHDVEHASTSAGLPAGVQLAYDGQVIDL